MEYDKTFGELNSSLLAYTILGSGDAGLQRQGTWSHCARSRTTT